MKKVSELVGMDVFTDTAKRVGTVQDVIIDLQAGSVARLSLEPIHAANKAEAVRLFKDKTILYRNVRAAEKIIMVSSTSVPEEEEPEPVEEQPKPVSSMRYRYVKK